MRSYFNSPPVKKQTHKRSVTLNHDPEIDGTLYFIGLMNVRYTWTRLITTNNMDMTNTA